MPKKNLTSLLLIGYLLPLSFFAMFWDFYFASLTGYLLQFALHFIAVFLISRLKEPKLILVGMSLSFLSASLCLVGFSNPDYWDTYFKPFSPFGCLLTITLFSLLSQYFLYYLLQFFKNKKDK